MPIVWDTDRLGASRAHDREAGHTLASPAINVAPGGWELWGLLLAVLQQQGARLDDQDQRMARMEAVLVASGPRDEADMRLLRALLAATVHTRFTAAEAIRHARVEPALAAALADADIAGDGAAIQLGLLLRRLAGTTLDGWQLARTPSRDRDGRIYQWRRWQE